MRYFACLVFLLTFSLHAPGSNATDRGPLAVIVTCPANPSCRFDGKDMEIAIKIQNRSNEEIGLNLSYIRRAGPYIKLYDNASGKSLDLPVSLVSNELLKEFHILGPTASVEFKEKIMAYEITTFRERNVNLDVKIAFPGHMKVGKNNPTDLDAIGVVKIVDKSVVQKIKIR